jgi:hypothetical protein
MTYYCCLNATYLKNRGFDIMTDVFYNRLNLIFKVKKTKHSIYCYKTLDYPNFYFVKEELIISNSLKQLKNLMLLV